MPRTTAKCNDAGPDLTIAERLYNSLVMQANLDRRFSALADPVRRAIIVRLALGEASVAELQRPFAISQPAISRHLRVLEQAGLIESGRAGSSRPRRLNVAALAEASQWIDHLRALWSDSFERLDALLQSPNPSEKDKP